MERSRKVKIKINDRILPTMFGLLSLFLCVCSSNEHEIQDVNNLKSFVINYNEDSTKVVSFGFVNEIGQNGEWFFLDDYEKIEKIQTFKNGILDGPVTEFLCCQKFSAFTYKNGLLEGEIVYYSKEGYISSKGYFRDGKPDGIWVDFLKGEILSIYRHLNENIEEVYSNPQLNDAIIGDEFFGCCETH